VRTEPEVGDPAAVSPESTPSRPSAVAALLRWAQHLDVLAVGAVLLVGLVVYWRFLRSGGLFFDDWWWRSAALYNNGPHEQTPVFGYMQGLADAIGYRPGIVVVWAVQLWIAGDHSRAYPAFALVDMLFAALALYAALRIARVPWNTCVATAVLFACIPIAASTRFWFAGGITTIGLGFLFTGFALGGLSLRAESRRRRSLLGAASVASLTAAALTYEAVIAVAAVLPLYYRAATGRPWRAVAVKLGVDFLAVVGAIVLFRTSARTPSDPVSTWWPHARALVTGGASVFLRTLTPDGLAGWTVLVVLVVAVGALVVQVARGPRRWWRVARAELRGDGRRAAVLAAVGLVAGFLGYLVFVPAGAWYDPLSPGQGDRTNGVATAGFSLAYGAIALGLATVLASAFTGRASQYVRDGLFVALVGLAALSFVEQSRVKDVEYIRAWQMSEALVSELPATFPNGPPPPKTMILSFGARAYAARQVPALADWADLDGAVKLALETGQVSAIPIFETQPVLCADTGVFLPTQFRGGPVLAGKEAYAYGKVMFINAFEHRSETIVSREQCQDALTRFRPGPLY
jgi:hypothetical protein